MTNINYRIDLEDDYSYIFRMPKHMIKSIRRIVRYKKDSLNGRKYGGIRHFLIVAANRLIEDELNK